MDQKTKIEKLYGIDENTLRNNILVPLLSRMDFKAVTPYHGQRERGKDIICFDYDRLGQREFIAVVAKAADLNGSVSSSDSLREVLYQIEQCFDVPYEDLYGMTRLTMDKVWVVTSKRIVPGAADSILDHLKKSNLSKLVRFISGENLIQLIDQHYQAYWDESLEPIDILKEQKHRLASFIRELLLSLGSAPSSVESTINQVIHSHSPPKISLSPDKTLHRISPYSVEVDSISNQYSHDFFSWQCGLVKDIYFETKQALYYAMFRVDEIVNAYEGVINKTDPRELINGFNDTLSPEYPFWHASFGSAYDAGQKIEYLEEGLNDIDNLLSRLSEINKLDWATALVDSVRFLKHDIEAFLSEVDKDSFVLYWKIEADRELAKLCLTYETEDKEGISFSTEHKKDVEIFERRQKKTRSINVDDVINEVLQKLREHFDQLLESTSLPKDRLNE